MQATESARVSNATIDGVSGTLVGLGVVTMALFPLALPILILTGIATVPLLIPLVPIAIVVALVVATTSAIRALGRLAGRRRRQTPQVGTSAAQAPRPEGR